MNILFVCHRAPYPPRRGGKIRPFNIIRHLSQSGHRVTVASLARSRQELDEARGLEKIGARLLLERISAPAAWLRMIARLPTARPSSFGYFYSGALRRRIEDELRRTSFDMIFVHCTSVAPYVAGLQCPLKFIDYGDMDSQKWREYSRHRAVPMALGYWLEAVKLERTERRLADGFDICTCTTRAELETLRALGIRKPSDWFPNGVDTEYFSPGPEPHDPDLIAFVGRMDYFPNQDAVIGFCESALPEIVRRRPGTRLIVIGAEPPSRIKALERSGPVTVTGSVPDVRPLLRGAALSIAPLRIARGTQNKILESMAVGVPVVSSPQAAGGVDAVPGEHLLTATDAGEMVDVVVGLLNDAARRQRLSVAARARVLSHHSWAASMRRLDQIIETAQRRRSGKEG